VLRIFTSFWNPGPYLARCWESLLAQDRMDWTAHFYDDCSDDGSRAWLSQRASVDSRLHITSLFEKHWQSGCLHKFIRQASFPDHEIVVQLDGDDWLPDPGVLTRVVHAYTSRVHLLMTYGNFIRYQGGELGEVGYCRQPDDFARVRSAPWTTSALKTHRLGLLRRIQTRDFLDDDGSYVPSAADLATGFPMLEMAGPAHSLCLTEINYVYNMDNPRRTPRARPEMQKACAALARSRRPYRPLTESEVRVIIET
jgi:glycosyltransferase involved in cell wall biosynthesis